MTEEKSIVPTAQLNVTPKTLLIIVGGGLLAGALIVLGAIMPAEYNTDPLGLGNLSGIGRLWAPDEKTWKPGAGTDPAHDSATPIVRSVVLLQLGATGWPEEALEYKFAMKPGQTFIYKWKALSADGKPVTTPVEFDFHGHTIVPEGEEMTVASYRKDSALDDTGSLTAPFEGIHGWYFKNHSDEPIMIRLEAEGFYDLVRPGQPGNEFRVTPEETTAETR